MLILNDLVPTTCSHKELTRQKRHIHDHTTHNIQLDAEMVDIQKRFLEKHPSPYHRWLPEDSSWTEMKKNDNEGIQSNVKNAIKCIILGLLIHFTNLK